jgi:predicted MPP superfamily phosphohydrolase
MFFNPHIDFLELPCDRLPHAFDGLVILHLSDLHITTWTRKLEAWRNALADLHPHALLITGDLGHRSWLWTKSFDSVKRLLEPLAPPLGTYFILGNHDSVKLGPALAETRDKHGRPRVLLQNETVLLHARPDPAVPPRAPRPGNVPPAPKPAEPPPVDVELPPRLQALHNVPFTTPPSPHPRLAFIGVHQHRRIDTDIPTAMRPVRPQDFKLMLLHYPDLIHPAVAAGADICLAGHTHGGQICWPDGSPLFRQDTLPAAMCTGVHRVNGTWMIVNRGIGAAGVKMRLFCPPHAVLMTLRTTAPRPL